MRALIALLIIGLSAGISEAALPSFDTSRLYSEAAFAAAIKPYTDAIARNANDAEAHLRLGAAYLYAFRLHKLGFAPYARGFGARAIASLERAVQLKAEPVALVTLVEAYAAVGDLGKYIAQMERVTGALAQPIPPK